MRPRPGRQTDRHGAVPDRRARRRAGRPARPAGDHPLAGRRRGRRLGPRHRPRLPARAAQPVADRLRLAAARGRAERAAALQGGRRALRAPADRRRDSAPTFARLAGLVPAFRQGAAAAGGPSGGGPVPARLRLLRPAADRPGQPAGHGRAGRGADDRPRLRPVRGVRRRHRRRRGRAPGPDPPGPDRRPAPDQPGAVAGGRDRPGRPVPARAGLPGRRAGLATSRGRLPAAAGDQADDRRVRPGRLPSRAGRLADREVPVLESTTSRPASPRTSCSPTSPSTG